MNEAGELVALLARNDLKKARDYPLATMDSEHRLRVGAAATTLENYKERVAALVNVGLDAVVVDSR